MDKDKIMYDNCPVVYCMTKIGGKWKPIVLYLISKDLNRFGKLHKRIQGISKQMLTTQLRELERDEIIVRKIYAEIPPRVEYFLTETGDSLMPIIQSMQQWGKENKSK
ncbi:helix-turn-helix domain-containing protein [uncultured Aquimarina sp.]|uniref:winged helix-turn-helix transcriptional regulator n=1 Tax=uncultured Aquimarina sp. TaxID=575652 RepID=UPI00261707BF|nr:helix-turn-helix domain-containing protein [uncultured Aquimarina sp.]